MGIYLPIFFGHICTQGLSTWNQIYSDLQKKHKWDQTQSANLLVVLLKTTTTKNNNEIQIDLKNGSLQKGYAITDTNIHTLFYAQKGRQNYEYAKSTYHK